MTAATETQWQMKPNIPLALQLAKRDIPALVYDAVNLEGVAMTLPEVQTLQTTFVFTHAIRGFKRRMFP